MGIWEERKRAYDTQQGISATLAGKAPTTKLAGIASAKLAGGASIWHQRAQQLQLPSREIPLEEADSSVFSDSWNVLKRIGGVAGKGVWVGLGVIAWPFERIEYTLATPLTAIQRQRRPLSFISAEQAKREWGEVGEAVLTGLKTWIPGKEVPEEAKTFNDFWGSYYKGVTGEEAPGWYKWTAGTTTSFAVTPAVSGKLLKLAGKGIKPIGKLVGVKKLPLWERAKLRVRAKVGAKVSKAKDLGRKLAKEDVNRLSKELSKQTGKHIRPKAVKQRISQVIKGSVTEQPGLREAANPAIQEFSQNFKTLQKLGILPKEVYTTKLPRKSITQLILKKRFLQGKIIKLKERKRFPGKVKLVRKLQSQIDDITESIQRSYKYGGTGYLPRMYTSKEATAPSLFRRAAKRIRAPYAKKRKDIPFKIRKAMGEIKEPAYPVVKRLIQQGSDIETAKLFDFASKQSGWTSLRWMPGLRSKPLPDTKAYGALRGLYAHPKIYNDVTELVRIKGNFERLYDTAIGTWKLGKVVWNPATHFRNKISNKILLDLSGMDYIQQSKYAFKALKHYKAGSKEYKIAKMYFARTTQVQGEIMGDLLKSTGKHSIKGLRGGLDDVNAFITKASKKPSAMYQHEEFINKFMKYLQSRDKGMSVIDSVTEANKWLFDYSDLAKWEKLIARRVMPFYTFPRKALPRVLEAAAARPHTIAKYPLAAKTMTQYSLYKLDLTTKDYEKIKKELPSHMKTGSYILMPYRDKNNDLRFFDWTYIVPWGELNDANERGLLKIGITNPLFQLTADISRNKSGWTDREIYKNTDTTEEKTFKCMKYIWQGLVPSLAYKGIYWDKLEEAATGKKTRLGKEQPLPEAIAHTVFGLRTQAIDITMQRRFNMYKTQKNLSELQGKMIGLIQEHKYGRITREEFVEKRQQYINQMRKEVMP